jgi:hypothetical protein
MQAPSPYSRSPIAPLPSQFADFQETLGRNLNLIDASIRQIIAYLLEVEGKIPPDLQARVYALEKQALLPVYLTAAGGGSTWNMSALTGYPNIRAVIIDPNGEANTLNLPALGATDKACVTVKCLSTSGNVTISAGSNDIVSASGGAPTLAIPYSYIADGLTIATYAVTLLWVGSKSEWHVIDTAIFTS